MKTPIVPVMLVIALAISPSCFGQADLSANTQLDGINLSSATEPLHLDLAAAGTDWQALPLPGLSMGDLVPPADAVSLASLAELPTQYLLPAIPGLDPEAGGGGEDKWWFQSAASLWAPGMSGDIGVGPVTASVNVSVIDVLEAADAVIGLMGDIEAGKGKIGGYVDFAFMKIGADIGPAGRTSLTSKVALVDFGLSYEIGRWAMEKTATPDHPARDLILTLTAGARYTDLEVDIDFDVLPDQSGSESWVDPMIGARVVVPFSQHWSLAGLGEIGGFGVSSDFAWTAGAVISWDFYIKEFPSALQFGYLFVGDDYTTGSGLSRYEWDTVLHGILLNFVMRF